MLIKLQQFIYKIALSDALFSYFIFQKTQKLRKLKWLKAFEHLADIWISMSAIIICYLISFISPSFIPIILPNQFFLAFIVQIVLVGLLKLIFKRSRPNYGYISDYLDIKNDCYSFPSGHATRLSAFAVILFHYHFEMGLIFSAFALFIGLDRIIVGVHYFLDVVSGYVLGILIGLMLVASL